MAPRQITSLLIFLALLLGVAGVRAQTPIPDWATFTSADGFLSLQHPPTWEVTERRGVYTFSNRPALLTPTATPAPSDFEAGDFTFTLTPLPDEFLTILNLEGGESVQDLTLALGGFAADDPLIALRPPENIRYIEDEDGEALIGRISLPSAAPNQVVELWIRRLRPGFFTLSTLTSAGEPSAALETSLTSLLLSVEYSGTVVDLLNTIQAAQED